MPIICNEDILGTLGRLLPTWLALHRPEPELPVAVWQVGENTCRPGGLGVNMLCCHGFRRGATQILEIKILCKIRSLNMYIICTYVPIYPLIASGWCKIFVCNAWTIMIAGTVPAVRARASEGTDNRQQLRKEIISAFYEMYWRSEIKLNSNITSSW